jgi:hypothetical protein
VREVYRADDFMQTVSGFREIFAPHCDTVALSKPCGSEEQVRSRVPAFRRVRRGMSVRLVNLPRFPCKRRWIR